MPTSSHTPGPWRQGDFPFDIVRSTSDEEYLVVATVAHDRQGLNRGREVSLANLRLIVQAPTLLAVTKKLVRVVEALGLDPVDVDGVSICELATLAVMAAEADGE